MIDERDGAPPRISLRRLKTLKEEDLFGDQAPAAEKEEEELDSSQARLTPNDFSKIEVEDGFAGYKEKEFSLDPDTIYDII